MKEKKFVQEVTLDDELKYEITKTQREGKITCGEATQIAYDLKKPMLKVGQTLDVLGVKIIECQLGLFGYKPQKKIVSPHVDVTAELKKVIEEKATDGELTCIEAWHIADRFSVPKVKVSSVCEALGIKIKSCQLGAF